MRGMCESGFHKSTFRILPAGFTNTNRWRFLLAMNKIIYFISLFLLLNIMLHSCSDDDYTTNPQHVLHFSADTLNFDTLFTHTGTSTYLAKVYNRNKKPLLISSVSLANPQNSGFRINVDGYKGTSFTDIEIAAKDSIYIFIEATLNAPDTDLPHFVKDSIVFLTNGVRQDIKLLAYGQNAFVLKGKQILTDTTFTAKRPILIYDSVYVAKNATLTLEAGTRLFFHKDAALKVEGKLIANGTIANPVLLRGDRTDYMLSNLPYDRLPGQWGGVTFYESSYNNELNYVGITGATYGIHCDASDTDHDKITITNSRISQTSKNALSFTSCRATVVNTEISNAGNNCVMLLGGSYDFIHCTIANYFSWNSRKGVALSLSNSNNNVDNPLTQAHFYNCIIAGSSGDELIKNQSANETVPFNYYFSHSLINSKEEISERINNVIWAKDDNFLLLDNTNQLYDFRLNPSSLAVDAGFLQYAASCPVDLDGVSRVSDTAPDAGCYELIQ